MFPIFLIPLIVAIIIQTIKFIIDYFEEKKFKFENIRRAGGFPSVHSGISSSITTLMFLKYGYLSPEFAISFVFSFLFWYDAMNIRYEAGKHAKYLNKITLQLKTVFNLSDVLGFKERLGHTFFEVIGGIIVGCILTIILYFLF